MRARRNREQLTGEALTHAVEHGARQHGGVPVARSEDPHKYMAARRPKLEGEDVQTRLEQIPKWHDYIVKSEPSKALPPGFTTTTVHTYLFELQDDGVLVFQQEGRDNSGGWWCGLVPTWCDVLLSFEHECTMRMRKRLNTRCDGDIRNLRRAMAKNTELQQALLTVLAMAPRPNRYDVTAEYLLSQVKL